MLGKKRPLYDLNVSRGYSAKETVRPVKTDRQHILWDFQAARLWSKQSRSRYSGFFHTLHKFQIERSADIRNNKPAGWVRCLANPWAKAPSWVLKVVKGNNMPPDICPLAYSK
jgi:hypothetical protein